MEFEDVLKNYEKSKITRREISVSGDKTHDVDLSELNVGIKVSSCFCKSEVGGVVGLNNLLQSTLEIKNHNSALQFNSLFIEYKTFFQERDSNEDSGIHTSTADLWYFQIGRVIHIYPTDYLKWLYNNKSIFDFDEKPSNDESHVATGFIVPISLIIPLYEQYERQKRLKELSTQQTKQEEAGQ